MSSSDSEEEIVIYAEFDENINIGKYRNIHVLGIDSSNPIIQMDDSFFRGKYELPMGTHMFFEEDPGYLSKDPVFDKPSKKQLKYVCKSKKFLKMDHAYVTPKEGKEQEHSEVKLQESEPDIEFASFSNIQDGINKFKEYWTSKTGESCSTDVKPEELKSEHETS